MRRRLLALTALLLALAGLWGCQQVGGWHGVEAATLLRDVAASRFEGVEPRRFTGAHGVQGDVYGDVGAPLVLLPGAARTGYRDTRLVAFARSLQRGGFRVLVPDIASLRSLRLGEATVTEVGDAIRAFAAAEGRPVGVFAVSFATGPALMATADGAPAAWVAALGGYHDVRAMLTYATTGWSDGQQREPNAYAKWVFVAANAQAVSDSGDRALLDLIANTKLANPQADVDPLVARLGPQGRAVYAFLANRDPDRVVALLANLPPSVRQSLDALDLTAAHLRRVTVPVLLLHGRDDPIVPVRQGEQLAAALPNGRLHVVDSITHADLSPTGMGDAVKLWRATAELLALRDRL